MDVYRYNDPGMITDIQTGSMLLLPGIYRMQPIKIDLNNYVRVVLYPEK